MEIKGVNIDFLGHSGFLISSGNGSGKSKRIVIDPYNVGESTPKADIILITHSHYDHCSIKDITNLAKPGTVIVLPADAQSKVNKIKGVQMQIMEVWDQINLGNVKIEAWPAYNKGKDFHPKSEGWLGYLIKMDKVIIYHSGDSDVVPEMQKLSGYGKHGNTFVALLPVSGHYVMSAEEAAELTSSINPDLAVPMHYGAGVAGSLDDAKRFVEMCKELNINAQILEKSYGKA